jgi:hypothetical protein
MTRLDKAAAAAASIVVPAVTAIDPGLAGTAQMVHYIELEEEEDGFLYFLYCKESWR